MQAGAIAMTAIAVTISLLSLLILLLRRAKRDAEVLFAVVSGSLALSLMSPWMANVPEWIRWAVAVGGSATCNGFWLVSRALFRGDHGVRLRHVLLAAGVALLIALHRGTAMQANASPSMLMVAIDAMLTLTSTSLLALSFLEPLRGWSTKWAPAERRLRLSFMVVYGSSVLSTTLLGELAHAFPALAPWRAGVVALCASAMIVFTHLAFRHRRQVPRTSQSSRSPDPEHAGPSPMRRRCAAGGAAATPIGRPAGLPRASPEGGRTGRTARYCRISPEQADHAATWRTKFQPAAQPASRCPCLQTTSDACWRR